MALLDTTLVPALQAQGVRLIDLRATLPRNRDWPRLRTWPAREPGDIALFVWHATGTTRPPVPYDEEARLFAIARAHIATDWGGGLHAPTIAYHLAIMGSGTVYQLNDAESITWHAMRANPCGIGLVVDAGPGQALLAAQRESFLATATALSFHLPGTSASPAAHFGHSELGRYGNATECPGALLPHVIAYRKQASQKGAAPMSLLDDQRLARVAAQLWSGIPFVPSHAIPRAWMEEWRAGRWRGLPLEHERPIDGGGTIQRFELGCAIYLPGQPVSWNG